MERVGGTRGGGEVPTLGLGGLGAELGLDLGDAGTKLCLVLDAPLDGLHPVHDRGVVTTVEELGDGLVGSVGMLLHQIHHYLSGEGKLGLAGGGAELIDLLPIDAAYRL